MERERERERDRGGKETATDRITGRDKYVSPARVESRGNSARTMARETRTLYEKPYYGQSKTRASESFLRNSRPPPSRVATQNFVDNRIDKNSL